MTNPPTPAAGAVLLTTETVFGAHAVAAVLIDAGIEATVIDEATNEALSRALGMRRPGVPVLVPPADHARARALLREHGETSLEIDWDRVELGDAPDDVPADAPGRRGRRRMPLLARVAFVVAVVVMVVTLVGALWIVLMG